MNKKIPTLTLLFLFFILLRLPNITSIPYYHWDEGINLDYANNLLNGDVKWSCIDYAFIPHPPLYYLVLAFTINSFGYNIVVARVISILIGALTTILLYLIGEKINGNKLGVVSSILFIIYPNANYWGRMVFNNNLLSLLVFGALFFLIKYSKTKKISDLKFSSILIGLSAITEFLGIPLLVVFSTYIFLNYRKQFKTTLFFIFSPVTLTYLIMGFFKPTILVNDLIFQIQRFHLLSFPVLVICVLLSLIFHFRKTISSFVLKILEAEVKILFNTNFNNLGKKHIPLFFLCIHLSFSILLIPMISEDNIFTGLNDYYWIGVIGLLIPTSIIKTGKTKQILLFFIPLSLTLLFIGRGDHMIIPLYGFLSIGLGNLILTQIEFINQNTSIMFTKNVIKGCLILPLLIIGLTSISLFVSGKNITSENMDGKNQVIQYVSENTNSDDMIFCSSNLLGHFDSKTYLFSQVMANEGCNIVEYFPNYLPQNRFDDNCKMKKAKYIVLREGNLAWMRENECNDLLTVFQTWILEKNTTGFGIYRNPDYGKIKPL